MVNIDHRGQGRYSKQFHWNANELIKPKIDGIFLLIIYMKNKTNAMVGE